MSDIFILIVDDKPQNLFALETILRVVPAKIIKANSGEEALALTLNYDFALAILDVQMPNMDGYELASYLLDDPITARIPIIFLSAAYSDEQHTFKGYEQGAVDYIVKPFEPSILLRKVSVFLELARYRIQLEELVQERTTALQEEERKLRSIVENTPDYIFNLDKEGFISFINAPKGYRHSKGDSIFDFLDKSDSDSQKIALRNIFQGQKKTEFESSLYLPWVPDPIPCSHRLSPIIVDQVVVGCLQIARDISDAKRAELASTEKLRAEAENQAKSKFLASMSHEIRTPMNAIIGYTQLLKRDLALTDKHYRYLEIIDSSGEHLLALIDSVLDMAKIESGRMVLSPTKMDIALLISDIVRMFQLTANRQGINLSFSQSHSIPQWIFADANKIRQVIINLVGNALKFTNHGSIELRMGLCEGNCDEVRLFIEVQDSGCGIEMEKLDSIFEPFVQANNRAGQLGVGLGLAVSNEIARLMNGSLSVNSIVNQGSTFRFEFTATIVDAPAPPPVKTVWTVTDEAVNHILVVDDDLDNLNMIGNLLTSVGLTVFLANSGQEGLRLFEEKRPGLVILDYQMEPLSGLEVTESIRRFSSNEQASIIMITASPFDEYREQSIAAGANAFLAKPFRDEELFTVIQNVSPIKLESNKKLYSADHGQKSKCLSPLEIDNLPFSLKMDLRKALRTGYLDEINLALDRIEETHAATGSGLRQLADNYQYSTLLSLLEETEVGHA